MGSPLRLGLAAIAVVAMGGYGCAQNTTPLIPVGSVSATSASALSSGTAGAGSTGGSSTGGTAGSPTTGGQTSSGSTSSGGAVSSGGSTTGSSNAGVCACQVITEPCNGTCVPVTPCVSPDAGPDGWVGICNNSGINDGTCNFIDTEPFYVCAAAGDAGIGAGCNVNNGLRTQSFCALGLGCLNGACTQVCDPLGDAGVCPSPLCCTQEYLQAHHPYGFCEVCSQ
jgi:hypothetical protein